MHIPWPSAQKSQQVQQLSHTTGGLIGVLLQYKYVPIDTVSLILKHVIL